jgi:division protein CdvB (Snf7/Vps24/ESCRT-III family)
MGEEVGRSRAFAVCQVEKVFQHVCFRAAATAEDVAEIERIADVFEAEAYSMKRVFAETAATCMGN